MKVKRFVVFQFTVPRGGWGDFVGSYDTVAEVLANHKGGLQLIDLETGLMGIPSDLIPPPVEVRSGSDTDPAANIDTTCADWIQMAHAENMKWRESFKRDLSTGRQDAKP